jgi:AcrR family transcriptional regulator
MTFILEAGHGRCQRLMTKSTHGHRSAMTQDRQATPDAGRSGARTRARILAAARRRFSEHSYENVGTRDIAADAGVDAALVIRHFGAKEKLFAEVLEGGFQVEAHLSTHLADLGMHLAGQLLADAPEAEAEPAFDPLRVLLRAAGNPAVAALVSERFHAEFVQPLARLLPGRDAALRAGLIASYVIGLATMRHGLDSPLFAGAGRKKAVRIAAAAIQACVDGDSPVAPARS